MSLFGRITFGFLLTLVALIEVSCSGTSTESTAFSCTFTGTLTSGSTSTVGTAVEASDIIVSIVGNTDSGPFTVTLPGQSAISTSTTSYSVTGPVSVDYGENVTVVDTASNTTIYCPVTFDTGTSNTGSTTISIVTNPSTGYLTATTGTISITATDLTGATSPLFAFTLASTPSGVSIQKLSTVGNEANVTSTSGSEVAVVVNVTEYESNGVTVIGSAQVTLCFGTDVCTAGSVPSVSFTASSYGSTGTYGTTSVPVGDYVTLTATPSGIIEPTFTYQLLSGNGNYISDYSPTGSPNIVDVTSTEVQSITVQVTATSTVDGTSATANVTVSYYNP